MKLTLNPNGQDLGRAQSTGTMRIMVQTNIVCFIVLSEFCILQKSGLGVNRYLVNDGMLGHMTEPNFYLGNILSMFCKIHETVPLYDLLQCLQHIIWYVSISLTLPVDQCLF